MGAASDPKNFFGASATALARARAQLKIDEGLPGSHEPALLPYPDSRGYLTIGWGRKLKLGQEQKYQDGISRETAEAWLVEDSLTAASDCRFVIGPAFVTAGDARQAALINMAFNLGRRRFSDFRVMIELIRQGRWNAAARAARNSRWHDQVGERAVRIEKILASG